MVISEIADTAAMGLVAIKLLAKYLGGKEAKVRVAQHPSPRRAAAGAACDPFAVIFRWCSWMTAKRSPDGLLCGTAATKQLPAGNL